jgi:hypothetical protein
VQATPFSGKAYEDASAHLQNFLEISSTVVIKNVAQYIILLHLFPFSLVGRAKQWLYTNIDNINTWAKCSKAFLEKFFPIGKTNARSMGAFLRICFRLSPSWNERFLRICFRLSPSWNERVVAHVRLLSWINSEGS